jgi:hypothetical protein
MIYSVHDPVFRSFLCVAAIGPRDIGHGSQHQAKGAKARGSDGKYQGE